MRAVALIFVVMFLLLWAIMPTPSPADERQTGKVFRIGMLWPTGQAEAAKYLDALRGQLRELGWVEGKNIVLESRFAEGLYERLPELAADLVGRAPHVIVTQSSTGAHALKQATASIPVVMAVVSDPVGSGFVASLGRPGGNMTGTSFSSLELNAKRLELLHQAVPTVKDIGVVSNPASDRLKGAQVYVNLEAVGRRLGLRLHAAKAQRPEELEAAFTAMVSAGARAVVVNPDPVFSAQMRRLVDLAARFRLPAIYYNRDWAEAGGLMVYAPNVVDLTRRAAFHVDKILRGARPADIPVEQPDKFELIVNLKTARALALTLPPSLLARVDHVIE